MKRIWIGIGLLAVMLVAGIWVSEYMDHTHSAIAEDLDRASRLMMQHQWEGANSLTARARKSWEDRRSITACFAEHEPLDEIDGIFAQLEIYAADRDEVACSASCVYLSQRLRALGKCHKFTLWNLL